MVNDTINNAVKKAEISLVMPNTSLMARLGRSPIKNLLFVKL